MSMHHPSPGRDGSNDLSPRTQAAAQRLVALLTEHEETVATCESLTAGMVSSTIATIPGASVVLAGGLVTYQTHIKQLLADVDQELLDTIGPYTRECAEQMALGAKTKLGTTWAVSLTGVAGPGSWDGHPAGEVFIGIADPHGNTIALRAHPEGFYRWGRVSGEEHPVPLIDGDRSQVRAAATLFALETLAEAIALYHADVSVDDDDN